MKINNLLPEERESLLNKIEKTTEVPMLILVIVMIGTLILPLVVKLDQSLIIVLEVIDWIIWAIFFIVLSIRVYVAPKRTVYLRKNWLDLLIVITPLLRIFRVLRVIQIARASRFVRVVLFFSKFTHELKNIFSRHGFHYLIVIFIGIIIIGTILIYNFEQSSVVGIKNIAESLWLVITNAFSGGFANIYPDTPGAKTMTMIIIIIGNVLVSYFTASLASYLTEKDQDIEQKRIEKKLDTLIKEINNLKNGKN